MAQLKLEERILAEKIVGEYKPGDMIWVRGKSGKGKSTLMKFLVKFRETEGIKINDVELMRYQNQSLRSRIVYLSQNASIVQGTLRENLFLNQEWTQEKEERLVQEPILQELLKSKTMDTLIDEQGANLSGGEKQRIAVARMLYDNADVFILDEITSNIDKESATQIVQRFYDIRREKIVFIISHDDLPKEYANKQIELG